MKPFDIHRYLSYEVAVASLALSFCMIAINSSLSELLGFQYSSLYTAVSMYLPALLALGVFLMANREAGVPLLDARGLILLIFLCGFWLVNYVQESHRLSSGALSEYDQKRIWFFVQGVLLSGLAGLHAPQDFRRFIRCFLISFSVLATAASLMYLLTYRPGDEFVRLLGERALGAGQIAGFGAASCLAVLYLHIAGSAGYSSRLCVVLTGATLINAAAVVLSATRGAALCTLVSAAMFVCMARQSKRLLAALAVLILPFVGLVMLAKPHVPDATIRRLTMSQHGFGLRYDLGSTMLNMIVEHPFGRVFGYSNSELGMEYSHNVLLQFIGEAGVLSTTPVLLVLLGGVIRKVVRHRAELHVRALGLFGVPVLLESFSAGSAYDPRLWFLIFFVFSLRDVRESTMPTEAIRRSWTADPAPGSYRLEEPSL